MKTASVTDAKNRLSALLDQVRGGESIVILDRGVPVARIEPIHAELNAAGRLRRLERAGMVRIGGAPPSHDELRARAPRLARGASAVAAILDERRSGR